MLNSSKITIFVDNEDEMKQKKHSCFKLLFDQINSLNEYDKGFKEENKDYEIAVEESFFSNSFDKIIDFLKQYKPEYLVSEPR